MLHCHLDYDVYTQIGLDRRHTWPHPFTPFFESSWKICIFITVIIVNDGIIIIIIIPVIIIPTLTMKVKVREKKLFWNIREWSNASDYW